MISTAPVTITSTTKSRCRRPRRSARKFSADSPVSRAPLDCRRIPWFVKRMSAEPFIRIRDLHQRFGDQIILRGVNLDIFCGETLALLGGSGGGKSVLIKHIPGLLTPWQGQVFVDGVEISQMGERQLGPVRQKIGMMFQGGALFDSLTVSENVAFESAMIQMRGNSTRRSSSASRSSLSRSTPWRKFVMRDLRYRSSSPLQSSNFCPSTSKSATSERRRDRNVSTRRLASS